ncbi:MlaD family protein [Tsukamurella paurometabola]|uniref:Virulence factor Mce family protein n=1 Tax=Tsukamurella paurometabola TaxID=2061 RepID=A0A3P8MD64_TSUPA|nr:MlaD family protein [Tsukamurella paurometabola]UEA81495.1 MlaD family protein [Tsukamurella paurometabola]VDR38493.1 virulence factor Mce family protein [Tsukamurella paurometabola]
MTTRWPSPVTGMMTPAPVLLRRGIATILAVVLAAGTFWAVRALVSTPPKTLTLVVRSVAPGVGPGTAVEMDGLRVGEVTDIVDRGAGRLGVAMRFNGAADDLVTDTVRVAFAPGNTFGITVVALTPGPGGRVLASGAAWEPTATPDDGTMASLLRSLSTMERESFRPHMAQLIAQLDTTTRQFLPFLGAVGAIAEANADTQRIPTADTLPTIAATLSALDASTKRMLPGLQALWSWTGPDTPGYPERQKATIDVFANDFSPALAALLSGPNVKALTEVLVPVRELATRTVASFPDAARNGRQLEELIERVRRSMPDTGSGPVLNLDVTFQRFPAIASLLPPLPEFSVTPPGRTPPPGTGTTSAPPKPTAGRAAPSTPAASTTAAPTTTRGR